VDEGKRPSAQRVECFLSPGSESLRETLAGLGQAGAISGFEDAGNSIPSSLSQLVSRSLEQNEDGFFVDLKRRT
jgi:hypothetical protein